MWARVSTDEGSLDTIDDSASYVRENILPTARQLAGYRGVCLIADRQTGKSMSVTLWDSEEDLRASETDADRPRQDSTDRTGGTIAGVERFEVVRFEVVLHEFTLGVTA